MTLGRVQLVKIILFFSFDPVVVSGNRITGWSARETSQVASGNLSSSAS